MKHNIRDGIKSESNNRHTGILWRLFGTIVIFVTLILLVIWVFQILLLNKFYESAKLGELEQNIESIVETVNNEQKLNEAVNLRSIQTHTCIRVYVLSDRKVEPLADSDVNMGCTIHHIGGDGLSRYFKSAQENGGTYTYTRRDDRSQALSTVMVSIIDAGGGKSIVIMQDAELQPLDVTVKTLQRQFGWITFILVIGALVVALLLARMICLPIQRMGQAANKLAKGDYDTRFYGSGYREAAELADALNFAASELQKNDSLQKELVANISHDLRTPLTMIKGYGEVMRDIPDENSPENIQVIIDETERLTELVNDMLDLSKIKSGTRKPEFEIFELTETIRAVLMRYDKLTEQQYVINFKFDQNICVNADRTMILQVVYNLVNNALNFTGEDKTVTISQTVSNNKVRISVTDSGAGIDQDDIPYIWDRYFKVDTVHKRTVVGTGLGLSIVKGILESHGATYGVESQKGVGSTFFFELDAVYDENFEGDEGK